MKKFLLIVAALISTSIWAGETTELNKDWNFKLEGTETIKKVEIPHSWNSIEVSEGRYYTKAKGIYTRNIEFSEEMLKNRQFLHFEAVSKEATIFVNEKKAGSHKGGYSKFTIEITNFLKAGTNKIEVHADNRDMKEILPISGDFNFFGGITRPVYLITKAENCISPVFYGSNGVFVKPLSVSENEAEISVETKLLINSTDFLSEKYELNITVLDQNNKIAASAQKNLINAETAEVTLKIKDPTLWDGIENPALYSIEVKLLENGNVVDTVSDTFGLRNYKVDPEKGFFLNGKHVKLKGVNRHHDRDGYSSALLNSHHDQDMEIMLDMGVNSLRLAHYQHADYFYRLCDSKGVVVWAEIPFVAFISNGFNGSEELKANGIQQLQELIYQNFNRPSIFFWGIYNEIKVFDRASGYIEKLQAEAKKLDPYRLTTAAANLEGPYTSTPDVLGWNKYDGWYGLSPKNFVGWVDSYHKKHPEIAFCISEYGAGASVKYDRHCRIKPLAGGALHPQNWQLYFHEVYWEKIAASKFIWGSYVWNMFDFTAENRNEGDRAGRNDKGLVTYDRETKKDIFYFYQANWREDIPVCYITGKNFSPRPFKKSNFKIYSNCETVTLYVNGAKISTLKPDHLKRCEWKHIKLVKGENTITVEGFLNGEKTITDSAVINY